MAADSAEVLPPLKKMAEITEHCVYHSGHKQFLKTTSDDNFLKKSDDEKP